MNAKKVSLLAIFANLFLFIIKLVAGILSNSFAVISDSINSLMDIISSVAVYISILIGSKKADEDHPFGHHRVQPVAALIVAILMGIVGFEVLKSAVEKLFVVSEYSFIIWVVAVLIITIILKLLMYKYLRLYAYKANSPALMASAIDSRNDILISASALFGFIGAILGYAFLDSVAAIVIGILIIKSGYDIGIENIAYLIGKKPDNTLLRQIKKQVDGLSGVIDSHDILAHYVGNIVHVEIHIEIDKRLKLIDAHNIAVAVRDSVQSIEGIGRAFVHVDPISVVKFRKGKND
jgi:cation diffusion facilitator family transporter